MNDDKVTPKDVDKYIDKCVCPECGIEDELGINDTSCEEKKCKKCGVSMMASLKEQNEAILKRIKEEKTIEGKFKILVDSTDFTLSKHTKMNKAVNSSEEDMDEVEENGLFNQIDKVNKDIDYKNKYHCNKCGIVISAATYEDEDICPKCGDDFIILENKVFLNNERRFICPQCSASYKYTKINEDTCLFCNSLMTVFDKPEIRKSKTAIPTE